MTTLNRLAETTRRNLLDEYLSVRGFTIDDISNVLDLSADDVAFVTGSLIDGVGDSQSDLDIYVLTSGEGFERRVDIFDPERRGQQQRRGFGIIYREIRGHALDAECHLLAKFEELVNALAALEPLDRDCLSQNFRTLGRFERVEAVELLHRLRVAVPIHGAARFEQLFHAFDDRKFLAYNMHFHLIEAQDYFKGVKRSLREHDDENAYLKLQRLYDSLADAKLFKNGASFDRWKWRLPKLRKLEDGEFLETYRSVQIGGRENENLHERVLTLLGRAEAIHESLLEQLKDMA